MRGACVTCGAGTTTLALTVASLLCLLAGNARAWSGNLLLNSGFENGNDHWGSYAYWGEPDPYPSASAVSSNPHSGSWSMRVGTSMGGRAQTVMKPRPGATYRVSAWGKVSTSGEVGWVGIEAYDIYGTKTEAALEFTGTSYEYKQVQFTAPATVSVMRVYAWKNDGTGYLHADDVVLEGPDLTYSPGGTTYYVDSIGGSDGYSGTSPSAAWETLDRVNSVVFAPGDEILLKAGCVWSGSLDPYGSGADGSPITIGSYGSGARPLIDGEGLVPAPLRLYNQQYWEVSGLELTNYHPSYVTTRYGALVAGEDFGELNHLHVEDLYVHDVNGLNDDNNKGNGGVIYEVRGLGTETWFNGVLVEGCTIESVDRSGVWVHSYWWDRTLAPGEGAYWVPSYSVVIRGNFVDDVGGDGIVPCECVAPLVEYNVVKDCNKRSGRYCVALWPWNCDDAVFQYNEAYLSRTTKDGEGFDSDWFSSNTIIQYNYSHDNEGGFCLICANGTYENNGINGYNDGTVVRYNISQNDQTRGFMLAGPIAATTVHNNTIYVGAGMTTKPIDAGDWGGWADDTGFYNNIFYNLGSGDYNLGSTTNTDFDYNVFYGNHPAGEPSDAHKLTGDPKLVNPGSAGIGRDTCAGYLLRWDSPCIDSGMTIPDSGGQDFWGNPVPAGSGADRGAHEFPESVSYGVLEVHPNERAQGPGGGPMVGTAPWAPSGLGPGSLYRWKAYQFEASDDLWIQVCGQCYSASQNAVGQADRLRMKIDGQTPPDVWGIMSGTPTYQWDGNADRGNRLTLEFQPVGLTAGLHTLELWADETPIIWWVKVVDLSAAQ